MIFIGTLFCNLHRDANGLSRCRVTAPPGSRGQTHDFEFVFDPFRRQVQFRSIGLIRSSRSGNWCRAVQPLERMRIRMIINGLARQTHRPCCTCSRRPTMLPALRQVGMLRPTPRFARGVRSKRFTHTTHTARSHTACTIKAGSRGV